MAPENDRKQEGSRLRVGYSPMTLVEICESVSFLQMRPKLNNYVLFDKVTAHEASKMDRF